MLLGVLCSVRRCRAGGNTRACRSNENNNQRYRKAVPMVVEDQSDCILLSITENAATVMIFCIILRMKLYDMV